MTGVQTCALPISQSETLTEKNEIAVKTIVSTAAGAGAGIIATIFLVGTPIGWGIVLGVGAFSALSSWGAGEVSGYLYKSQFADTDIVNSLGISKICN